MLMPVPAGAETIEDLAEDDAPLGTRAEVLAKLRAALPQADFSDPTWGIVEGPDYSVEVNLGDEEPVSAIMLHVRGGDSVMQVIRTAAKALGCGALDCNADEVLDLEGDVAGAGLQAWREYKDRVVPGVASAKKKTKKRAAPPATRGAAKGTAKGTGRKSTAKGTGRKSAAKGTGRTSAAKRPAPKRTKTKRGH